MTFFDWFLAGAGLWLGWAVAPFLLLFIAGASVWAWLAVSDWIQKLQKKNSGL